ncbi:Hemerythrin domain-containing protein OS=Streptomyces alboniger OX=132473 GN=CP975_04255 PE=4 SV=1 [Streptomyces alboniger]
MFPSQDVVKLILKDHRIAEDLLRQLRHGSPSDRRHALRDFAQLYIAHVRAEEAEVYPALKRYGGIDNDQIERGVARHGEGAEALLDLLDAYERSPCAWDARLEELVTSVTDYADETERHAPRLLALALGALGILAGPRPAPASTGCGWCARSAPQSPPTCSR